MTENQSKTKIKNFNLFREGQLSAFGVRLAFINHSSSVIRHAFILKIHKLILACLVICSYIYSSAFFGEEKFN